MIHLDVPQGQSAWHWARLGIPTASQFSRILTPKKREYASGAQAYIHELCSEWITGIPYSAEASGFMERGTELEPQAFAWYEIQTDLETKPGGVCIRDDLHSELRVACSPDRLVGDKRGAEFKTPSAKVHVANLLGMTDEHFSQVQGNLYVTGRESWDLVSFNPVMPSVIVPMGRDEKYIDALDQVMRKEFLPDLQRARQTLLALGARPATKLAQEFASSLAMRADSGDPF